MPCESELFPRIKRGENSLGKTTLRLEGKARLFNNSILWDEKVAPTITATGPLIRQIDATHCTKQDIINASTFPQDYNFMNKDVKFICGMSVPPNMMANIAEEIYKQWLSN